VERITKVFLNLIEYLSRHVWVQPQQLSSQALMPIFIDNIVNLNKLMVRVTPHLESFQVTKLLEYELVLCS
jgi:hypothetical protein